MKMTVNDMPLDCFVKSCPKICKEGMDWIYNNFDGSEMISDVWPRLAEVPLFMMWIIKQTGCISGSRAQNHSLKIMISASVNKDGNTASDFIKTHDQALWAIESIGSHPKKHIELYEVAMNVRSLAMKFRHEKETMRQIAEIIMASGNPVEKVE